MPLGDSNTRGKGGSTWRLPLRDTLRERGIEIRFVGSCPHAPNDNVPWGMHYLALHEALQGNVEHEGWGGIVINDLVHVEPANPWPGIPDFTVEEIVQRNRSDIVLLMIGTNDLLAGRGAARTFERFSLLLDRLLESTGGTVMVASIPPAFSDPGGRLHREVMGYNCLVRDLVSSRAVQGRNVQPVDVCGQLQRGDFLSDGIHLGIYGNRKVAAAWAAAIATGS